MRLLGVWVVRSAMVSAFALMSIQTLRAELPRISFAEEVQPILAQHCYECHGPDAATRKADLRLDQSDSALQQITPGNPLESELYQRLISSDPGVRMPPPSSKHQPSLSEIATLKRWIEQGAEWEDLWSLQPVKRPEFPEVKQKQWPRNGIDYFTLAKLEANHRDPSPSASKYAWLRRVTFDLTGLPPTTAEIAAFVADDSEDAERKVIDRLLASSAYGENFARQWLDLARYADTHGYNVDSHRDMWRYREWVIQALNENMPFDQFTIEQIAGDLLPRPTIDQLTATGFHRNVPINDENGAFDEEYRHAYVVDRVNTTGTVWLGMTLGCAQCHDHKYDPISQRDYYQLAAFFDSIDEKGLDGEQGNAGPVILSPTREQQRQLAGLQQELQKWRQSYADYMTTPQPQMLEWESTAREEGRAEVVSEANMLAKLSFNHDEKTSGGVEVVGDITLVPGKQGNAILAGGDVKLALRQKLPVNLSVSAWIYPTISRRQVLFHWVAENGEQVELVQTAETFLLRHVSEDGSTEAWQASAEAWTTNVWQHLAYAIDHETPKQSKVWVNGKSLTWTRDDSTDDETMLEVAAGDPGISFLQIRGLLDNVRVDAATWLDAEVRTLSEEDPISALLSKSPRDRTEAESLRLKKFYLRETNGDFVRLEARLEDTERKIELLKRQFPETMVMRERDEPRTTHIRKRGEWDQLGDVVKPGVPKQIFGGVPDGPKGRLELAKWLVDAKNPLTARVVANRAWQHYFGTGLVQTVDDFGTRGALPSHPELLDYLASELVQSGWDLKHLHRLIASSQTYRQSSQVGRAEYADDPENRLLGRGPRLRLSGEEIRDQALAASGLLVRTVGGVSVKPYQPEGLWEELSKGAEYTAQRYVRDQGERLYRRSLYTYWKRSSPPPNMAAFDAPNREVCTATRSRTNTPIQALVLLNDVTFVEAAKVLAADLLSIQPNQIDRTIEEAFLRIVSRPLQSEELGMLRKLYDQELERYENDPESMQQLLSVGDKKVVASPRLAAMTIVCHAMFNLDEAVMTP